MARQGCVLSAALCNVYTEKTFRNIDDVKGLNIGAAVINDLR